MTKIGIIGIGFVGGAMLKSFIEKGYIINENLFIYDKYKNGGIGTFSDIVDTDILFVALPTLYLKASKNYDLSAIEETLQQLKNNNYNGIIVIKSTIEPTTTEIMAQKYGLNLVHNPEFLTARHAFTDFHNQKHIVLGKSNLCEATKYGVLCNFYKINYPDATISCCSSTESESMKLFLNNFYAVKVQFFTEIYLLCQKLNLNYESIRDLMLKNGWINSMHTQVPGPDGNVSYGGLCFPKDTTALLHFMESLDVPCEVIKATVEERNEMRKGEDDNIIKE
ncbi:UDP-glucose 6-dehydrogenase [Fadolivirus algeromassiliense]|jgi:UDPglucose 6-dehydrogenase|uniref:UDP-glucose 6-dehydrogenase n=1 Tax=Fadolivirus FV1/VV64 TaxID=3070911 RepID=A0A7D3QUH4_9VIRU|nr:UDP-glucose 6-dehydrogenase [Fadolivirus algeromassiliense]QKF94143.1 UDP-glucose 6-dehydrogenase [Fadolivirus FV1/VV64]